MVLARSTDVVYGTDEGNGTRGGMKRVEGELVLLGRLMAEIPQFVSAA